MNVRDLVNSPVLSSTVGPSFSTGAISDIQEAHQHAQTVHSMFSPAGSVAPSRSGSPNNVQDYRKASIVLIGMRGVGKTTLATVAGKALGWDILDTDGIFERRHGASIADFIAHEGWDAFREVESEILQEVLRTYPTGRVIACGGGIIELEKNRALLQQFRERGPVIHVLRDKEAVLDYLKQSTHFPPYIHETAREAWDRRAVLFRECCSFEFVSLTVPIPTSPQNFKDVVTPDQTLALKPVEEDFFRLLRFIHGVDTNKVVLGPRGHRTYFLALTYRDVREAIPVLDDLLIGIDLWEVRVDMLASLDPTEIAFQIASLRRHSRLPILFTIRTHSQGGDYPDVDENDIEAVQRLSNLLHHALRLAVEYIDIEVVYPPQIIRDIMSHKGNTSIIGSYHDTKGCLSWSSPVAKQIYDRIASLGVDIVEIVNTAKSFEDNMNLRQFAASVERNPLPLLAINMGPEGKMSRALNTILCPVSHPLLPKLSAPGQISFRECQTILYLTGLLPAKKFYVFGNPIKHSMSPPLHNAAFSALGLPHTYEVFETASIERLKEIMYSPNFGGASVTIPHKRSIMPLLQHLSRHARAIGAVNTITAIPGPVVGFSGDNTDWRSIKTCLLRSLTPAHVVTSSTTALVLGAGGTARATLYALHQLGVINIYIYNRTRAKAIALAEEFNRLDPLLRIRALDSLTIPLPIHTQPTIIISTIPAIPPTPSHVASAELIDLGLREEHLSSAGGVALELAYEHRITNLLALAEQRRRHGIQWVGVEGIELLLEQGYEQCKIWTGRTAPTKQIREKVLEAYKKGVNLYNSSN